MYKCQSNAVTFFDIHYHDPQGQLVQLASIDKPDEDETAVENLSRLQRMSKGKQKLRHSANKAGSTAT